MYVDALLSSSCCPPPLTFLLLQVGFAKEGHCVTLINVTPVLKIYTHRLWLRLNVTLLLGSLFAGCDCDQALQYSYSHNLQFMTLNKRCICS